MIDCCILQQSCSNVQLPFAIYHISVSRVWRTWQLGMGSYTFPGTFLLQWSSKEWYKTGLVNYFSTWALSSLKLCQEANVITSQLPLQKREIMKIWCYVLAKESANETFQSLKNCLLETDGFPLCHSFKTHYHNIRFNIRLMVPICKTLHKNGSEHFLARLTSLSVQSVLASLSRIYFQRLSLSHDFPWQPDLKKNAIN